jgi:hypothetical protein
MFERKHSGILFKAAVLGSLSLMIAWAVLAAGGAGQHAWCALSVPGSSLALPGCWSGAQLTEFEKMAAVAPSELRADAYIRLVSLGRAGSRKERKDLLARAFDDSSGARWKAPYRSEFTGRAIDGTRAFYHLAGALGVDRLSLQCRAVRDTAAFDQESAVHLFTRIVPPTTVREQCSADSLEDPAPYLETASVLFRQAAPPSEVLAYANRSIGSSLDLRPLTRFLATTAPGCGYLRSRLERLGRELAVLDDTDRDFGAATLYHSWQTVPKELTEACQRCGVPVEEVTAAFGRFVARQLGGPRCVDNASSMIHRTAERTLYRELGIARKAPVTKPVDMDPRAGSEFAVDPAKSAMKNLQQLTFRAGSIKYTAFQRRTVEWNSAASRLFSRIESWTQQEFSSPAVYFHCRVLFLSDLASLAPAGGLRDELIGALVKELAHPPADLSPGEWLQHILFSLRGNDPQAIDQEIEQSGSAVLKMYARLYRAGASFSSEDSI